jgi:hypothetical protein
MKCVFSQQGFFVCVSKTKVNVWFKDPYRGKDTAVPKYYGVKSCRRHVGKVPGENALLSLGRVACTCYVAGVVALSSLWTW